jgi:transcriptional regulator with XRE-family HTH domain
MVVREARKAIGLTQQALADQAEISRRAMMLLERGGGRTTTFVAVVDVLGLRVTGLPGGASLHQQLESARRKRRMTQAELADRAGVSIPTVRELETGGGLVTSLSSVLAVLAPDARRRRHPRAHWAKKADERFTPPAWLRAIEEAFGKISLDPCHDPRSFVQAERNLTIDNDGLTSKWCGRLAYVNPPYSQNSRWIHRCADAYENGEVETVIALLPARTEIAASHARIFGRADLLLLRGKPRFFNQAGEQMSIAPFAAMICIWGGRRKAVATLSTLIPSCIVWAKQISTEPEKRILIDNDRCRQP